MKTLAKAVIGSTAIGAMALASATPAMARDYDDRDGIGIGDIVAGAVILGGIAAVTGAIGGRDRDDDYYRNDRYRDYRDGRYGDYRDDRYGDYRDDRYRSDRYRNDYRNGSPRRAVEQCVSAAERDVRRYGVRNGDVTDIRKVDRKNGGYRVEGRIAVDTGYRGSRYGRGWDNDYRGWNDRMGGWDSGKFTCDIRDGRVTDIRYSGIRDLRR